MKEIAQRAWHEPAVFIGLVTSIAIAVITVATGDHWDTATIAGVVAPLVSALGIRPLVTPAKEVVQPDAPPPGEPPPES